ncbi:OmpA family protein [Limnofasciculus baicalensis]|uniref:OmpA family protein n=1 Tax=Limnofasciculus baicalensis BBK-W-15 TaxID=2699891 RepID=A0AAE3KSJ6_9CYAN|nr:OmpA family protein [Limnofasciculus baicalensis]MCP2732718.1 OmpA family protein [Limnofasciculus baicalensis BBK-W-15]
MTANSADKTSPQPSTRRRSWLLVVIFRVLMLGLGGGVALILGIVLANVYPSPNPQKPLVLKIQSYFDKPLKAAAPKASPTGVSSPTEKIPQLSPVERQQVEAQLTDFQVQLKAINDKVTTLETQLGTSRPNDSLERRIQAISLLLQGVQPPSENDTSVGSADAKNSSADSLGLTNKLKITLPSDVLFDGSNSILRPEAGLILDQIMADLRNYPASTIHIAGYTDSNGDPDNNRALSFLRAKAVEQYFARTLGREYRWLVIGYGATNPVAANDTDANQQRNRRIEISVD